MKAETKSVIRSAVAELISSLAIEHLLTPEEVANEAFYSPRGIQNGVATLQLPRSARLIVTGTGSVTDAATR